MWESAPWDVCRRNAIRKDADVVGFPWNIHGPFELLRQTYCILKLRSDSCHKTIKDSLFCFVSKLTAVNHTMLICMSLVCHLWHMCILYPICVSSSFAKATLVRQYTPLAAINRNVNKVKHKDFDKPQWGRHADLKTHLNPCVSKGYILDTTYQNGFFIHSKEVILI